MRRTLLALGLCCLPFAGVAAQDAANDQLARGGYAVIFRNASGCSVTVDGAREPLMPSTEGMRFLSHSIFDAVRPDGTMMLEMPPRSIRVDGREVARASRTAYLNLWVSGDCSVSVNQMRHAEMLGNVESRIRFLEGERAADIRTRIIGSTVALLGFGAAAYYSSSDAADADTYSAVGLGVGLGSLIGAFTLPRFDAQDREQLALNRRYRAELTRAY